MRRLYYGGGERKWKAGVLGSCHEKMHGEGTSRTVLGFKVPVSLKNEDETMGLTFAESPIWGVKRVLKRGLEIMNKWVPDPLK
jgi:hypothetical protein